MALTYRPLYGGGAVGVMSSTGNTQSGSGPFGAVPGPVSPITAPTVPQPTNPYVTLSGLYPNLGGANATASSAINSEMEGQLSPGTISALTNLAAERGISSGMGPGSGLWNNAILENVAGASEALTNQGLSNFGSILPMISNTETITPQQQIQIGSENAQLGLQTSLANQEMQQWNNIMAAAPNPAQAQSYAQQLFQEYLNRLGGPGRGTSSSSGPWTPPMAPSFGAGGFGSPLDNSFFPSATDGGYGPAYADPAALGPYPDLIGANMGGVTDNYDQIFGPSSPAAGTGSGGFGDAYSFGD